MTSKAKTKWMMRVSMLAAVAVVLMYLEFPLPLFPPWLQIDFSDIPALLGGIALGPWAAVAIEVLKNLVHILLKGLSFGGAGQLANLLIGLGLVLPAALWFRAHPTRRGALIGIVWGTLCVAIVGPLANVFILVPAAGISTEALAGAMTPIMELLGLQGSLSPMMGYGLLAVAPFNIIKGLLGMLVVGLLYKPLLPTLSAVERE